MYRRQAKGGKLDATIICELCGIVSSVDFFEGCTIDSWRQAQVPLRNSRSWRSSSFRPAPGSSALLASRFVEKGDRRQGSCTRNRLVYSYHGRPSHTESDERKMPMHLQRRHQPSAYTQCSHIWQLGFHAHMSLARRRIRKVARCTAHGCAMCHCRAAIQRCGHWYHSTGNRSAIQYDP
ncbi:hypothetical protein BCR44DRAFT_250766 [Catenaria anguillulae PL171]|uniref:Uncharacterized protein n=1 Tax=Catenaria anguillulae PL171 TaxID=765915 RepID=A0A1Y2HCT2_9FUNG|nr:hypothetical protein BCR44DRAFT_250766 [Catenaria anguillulae PL171]